ncbi:MAG: peptidoglycan-binding protein, partial [Rhizobiaceae bacterium]
MNSKRSYLDTLNAGRQRRPHATLEQLNRSLEILERRLGDREAREPSPRPATRPGPDAAPAPRAYDRPSREASLAPSRPAEPARPRQPDDEAALGRVTGEIRTLREDLRQLMSTGMRREFETLRKDLEASHAAGEGKTAGHLGAEFDRLAGAIQALAERHDDRALEALREEIGQMRALADSRAETAPAWFGHRIDDLEERVAIGLSQLPSSAPEVAMLGRHLDVIAGVLAALPDSRAVRAIEDNMRELAGAVDRLAGQQSGRSEATFAQIDERLNEISRAIVAATVAAQSPHIDPEPFRRIEARVADLAGQIDELSAHRNDDDLARRLDHISDRMEHVAESAALPGLALDRLAGRIADIAEAVERAPAALDADRMMAGLEEHLHRVSDMLAGERGEAERQNGAMMREIEARIDSIVARIDGHRTEMLAGTDSRMGSIEAHMADLAGRLETLRADPAVGLEALRGIEMRMQHVAERFDLFSERYSGFDPDTIAGLERQVAELADRLSTPNAAMRDVEDMGLRLDEIEQAI